MLSLKINGQRVDLNDVPDLLMQLLVSVTNLEERFNLFDKRLKKLERTNHQAPYLVEKRQF